MNQIASNNGHASSSNLTFRELLDYSAEEMIKWRRWFKAQPASVLDLPFDEGKLGTVRGVLQHIVVVERRYADRLLGNPLTPYEAVPLDSSETIFEFGVDARAHLERYLAGASDADLTVQLDFPTRSAGIQVASARKIVAHALVHGIRHFAQLATMLRQEGHPTDWFHDILMSTALR